METTLLNVSARNAELVRRGYAAFNTADMKTLAELFHEDSCWHTPGKSHMAGKFGNRDAVFAHFGQYGAETHGTFQAILKDVAQCGDGRIVGIHRNIGERNGKKLEVDCCIVFEFKGDKVIAGSEYFFDLYAWDAFWS